MPYGQDPKTRRANLRVLFILLTVALAIYLAFVLGYIGPR